MGTEADHLIDQNFDRKHGEYGDEMTTTPDRTCGHFINMACSIGVPIICNGYGHGCQYRTPEVAPIPAPVGGGQGVKRLPDIPDPCGLFVDKSEPTPTAQDIMAVLEDEWLSDKVASCLRTHSNGCALSQRTKLIIINAYRTAVRERINEKKNI